MRQWIGRRTIVIISVVKVHKGTKAIYLNGFAIVVSNTTIY